MVTPQNPRVLVIEDDEDVAHLLGSHLRRLGCVVSTAATGEEGIAQAVAQPPDVIVVDILLPGIDGRHVVRALRANERTRHCRVVVSSVLDREDLLDIPTDAVLPKPFSRRDVARLLTSLDDCSVGCS